MGVAPKHLHFQQVSHNLIQQTFSLMLPGYRKAAQSIAKAAAGGKKNVIFIKQTTGVVQISIPADSLPLQQLIHLLIGQGIPGLNFRDRCTHYRHLTCILRICPVGRGNHRADHSKRDDQNYRGMMPRTIANSIHRMLKPHTHRKEALM